MVINLGTEDKTTWKIGGALAVIVVAVVSLMTSLVQILFLFAPGNGDVGVGTVHFIGIILRDSWPYYLADLIIAGLALGFLMQSARSRLEAPWSEVASRALVLLLPAVVALTTVFYTIGRIKSGSSGFFDSF